jgi:hypothetical protein
MSEATLRQLQNTPIVEEVPIVRVDENQRWNSHILRQKVRYDGNTPGIESA